MNTIFILRIYKVTIATVAILNNTTYLGNITVIIYKTRR